MRWHRIVLSAAVCAASCDQTTEPQSRVAIEAATTTDLAGVVGTEVTPAPAVRATDATGRPLPGVAISFELGSGGGSIPNASVETDAGGLASVGQWTLGFTAGTNTMTARYGRTRVVFRAMARAGLVGQITPLRGNLQDGPVGEQLTQPLRVKVADAYGNPVAGASVTFRVLQGGGSIENGAVITDSDGTAESGLWTLGSQPGDQTVSAQTGAITTTFSATAYVGITGLPTELAFVSERAGNSEIYTINADGSGLERLTTNAQGDDAPAWSPDGTQIAFASNRGGASDIYVMAADGSNIVRRTNGLLPAGGAHELSWSPSGSAIAFTTLYDGHTTITTVSNADGTVVRLTNDRGFNSQPSWSPDGRQFAFVSDREAYDFVFHIYTMNADGSAQTRRTPFGDWSLGMPHYFYPAWSPDGKLIAFVYGNRSNGAIARASTRFNVGIMSADGVFIRDIAWAGDSDWLVSFPPGSIAWSPDGRGIAYTFLDCDLLSGPRCATVPSIKYASLDGTQRGTIVSNAHSPSWRR